jgi:hypothetical protein
MLQRTFGKSLEVAARIGLILRFTEGSSEGCRDGSKSPARPVRLISQVVLAPASPITSRLANAPDARTERVAPKGPARSWRAP